MFQQLKSSTLTGKNQFKMVTLMVQTLSNKLILLRLVGESHLRLPLIGKRVENCSKVTLPSLRNNRS